ncbi:MAG: carbamoyltransferase N-terminal domain-containing protein [Candidatus Gastranaerophilaceae bacterium]|jgi:N6-L-threonylcarbamoyladenine synthase
MKILAIDTTGFTTSISIVDNGRRVILLKNKCCFIKNRLWRDFVVELPIRHKENLLKIVKSQKINFNELDFLALSSKSGISNCLVIGEIFTYLLAQIYKKEVLGVDHILAHVYSCFLERDFQKIKYPILVFSASGSHSDIALIKNVNECEILTNEIKHINKDGVDVLVGIGKIFDHFSRRIGISTPFDFSVEKLDKICFLGDQNRYRFRKYYNGALTDMNFSGFLEKIMRFYEKNKKIKQKTFLNDVAASFQKTIIDIIVEKIIFLADKHSVAEIHLAGGVSCNGYLRTTIRRVLKDRIKTVCRFPKKKVYSLDNAAMVACLAYYQKKYNIKFKNFKPAITK